MSTAATAAVEASLARIAVRDPAVQAWAWLDAAGARAAALASDAALPLDGLTLGVKDVIDVAGLPTAHGSPVFADTIAGTDAAAVARLRAAGAIVLGKTVTAEFATYSPGATVNPHRPGHTPGGSSSGSAAAVADRQCDIALGTQTAGSMIRPASFCGVLGFKPSFGRYPLDGVLSTAPSLDTLGVFARSLDVIVRVDAVLAAMPVVATDHAAPIVGLCRADMEAAAPTMRDALDAFVAALRKTGVRVVERSWQRPFTQLAKAQALIHRHEAWQALGHLRCKHADRVSAVFRDFIDAGARDTLDDYAAARAVQRACRANAATLFDSVDVLLTPGAPGPAPAGLASTGDPVFQRAWTALGVPCLGFPAAWTAEGLPLGLQLVGRPGGDRALLAAAATIVPHATRRQE